ncbi:ead/Ea22-like family protein, partial [Escherichia albertii]|uniref:ead/Ea22-like family protein n=1 Tax=Escherichia albertii TaxID=208962 RepID=UPI003530F4C6
AVRVALNLVANMQRLEMTARFFIQRLELSGISEQRRQPVSKIDYQALREAAESASKINWTGLEDDLNADGYMRTLTRYIQCHSPIITLSLLDERDALNERIAELEKQCAEWERKASSNFEECAAMAERIEELEKTTTGQDANINSQQERVAQSANRHVYHYNAVSNVSGITMSGIAQSPFRIKSQSDLEEFKSALSKVCGFHATAVTSLSYLGREEEE